ncbi:hypothetical protein C8R46DRAFT_1198238 [Mycena filopes]|nr:hypothetical protein C8R46DRAFT_1198238 [Mycena filopes]
MHSSLRPERFSGLSASNRGIALAAMNGPVSHLQAAVRRVELAPEEMRFLPLFYHHLDPRRIPNNTEMDQPSLAEAISAGISRALLAFQGLFHLVPSPDGSCADLWMRVWPWAQFFDAHHHYRNGGLTEDTVRAYCFLVVVRLMRFQSPTSHRILTTPGIGIFAAQAWGTFLRDPGGITERAFYHICQFLIIASGSQQPNFEELLEGAGGADALATLVFRTLEYLLVIDTDPNRTPVNLASVLTLCLRAESTWLDALVAQKVFRTTIPVLLYAATLLDRTSDLPGLYEGTYERAWTLFVALLLHGDGYARKSEAIKAGFLELVVTMAQKHLDWADTQIRPIITAILPSVTLYPSVLSAITAALPVLEEATSSLAFTSSPVYPYWREFITLAVERIDVKRQVDSGESISRKACDNLQCAKILPKTAFKRCSGCEYAHYCSKECQSADWRDGHREGCPISRSPGSWRDGPSFCTARDRVLIRAIVRHDYEQRKEHIFLARICAMREDGAAVTTVWGYGDGRPRIEVVPDANYAARSGDWAERAVRSGGRIHLNAVHLENREDEYWVLPLRVDNAEINDALYAVSRRLPRGVVEADVGPEVVAFVRRLVERSREITEII